MAFKLPNSAQNQRNDRGGDRDDFVPSEFWANIGYWDTIDGEQVFVSLTRGIALDDLKPQRGNSELTRRKNRLNQMVIEAAHELEPGQGEDVIQLVVQLRRTSPAETAVDPETTTLTRLTFGSKAA